MSIIDGITVDAGENVFDDDSPLSERAPSDSLYDGPTDGDSDAESKEKAPKRSTGPRASASQLVTLAWGGVGTMLERSGTDPAVGRVLQFQAPLAGERIDDLIKGTWIDSLVQPFVKQADKLEGLGTLILFPVLIGAYERNPAIGGAIEGILRDVVTETLIELAPVIKKRTEKAKRAAKSMASINADLGIDPDENPVDAILAQIFAPPPAPPENPPEP